MKSKIIARASTPSWLVFLVFAILAMFSSAHAVAGEPGQWHIINTEFGESRHEGASAQAGEAFYVLGGRESDAVRIYDPFDGEDGSWSSGAISPIQLHHFQAVELDGLIYAIGAMTGPYPEEDPVDNVYIYDPLADRWIAGPPLPPDRLRGSSGTIVHDGLIYWISGNTNGHVGPVTDMVDVYNPATGSFTPLAEIPNPRDHFFATEYQGSIYVIGGRRSVPAEGAFEPTIPEIDVYDIAADTWQTLPANTHLNPPRAAAATDRIGDEIIIAGGESGSEEPMAHVEAQAFNPATGQWRNLADMLTPRHAAQAIVSNDGFYVAAGSPFRGGPGGAVLNTEALFLAGVTTPTGIPITGGAISAPASFVLDSATGVVPISHLGGNQAVIIKDIQISGSAAFSLAEPLFGPVSLAPGTNRDIVVIYTSGDDNETAVLEITDSNDQVTTVALEAESGVEQTILFRVNAGGGMVAALDDGPDWAADTLSNPSVYLAAGGDSTNGFPVQAVEPTVPASTPTAIFESERWDPIGGPEMLWQFPVAAGTPVEVRLYLMNGFGGTSQPGERVFDIEIDGALAFSAIDLAAEAGHQVGTVRTYQTIADGMIDIEFLHQAADNPLINGIEIVQAGVQPDVLSALPTSLDFGQLLVGPEKTLTIMLRNQGGDGDPVITINNVAISDAAFSTSLAAGISLAPGDDVDAEVTFGPNSIGLVSASLDIAHTGSNSPLTINLTGEGVDQEAPPPIAFSSQTITSRLLPTQLEFGPDERLYVAELDGLIYAFTIVRNDETGNYSIVATEVIDLIQTIPNHDDDGTPYPFIGRSVTGMITAGTADNPVLFVTSSDPRFDDPQADTNSGILSRLTWTGSEWTKLDLVRSLPRSAHDHFTNGMALDADNGILYLSQGGHTNMGAPSFSFGYLPEYALSAAILSIDLNAIGEQTYDIPTLKGEVFGGQAGNNQAMIVPGGPVQVHSPGYRNAYDVLLTTAGRLYTFDNDSNAGWGGLPIGEGPGGTCTNQSNESDSATYGDNFHLITGPGYYGGHPNPTRGNRSNTFEGLSPIPEGLENPGECEFLIPGVEDGALALYDASTNGLAEYTATNFIGQMTGNIIATAWDGKVLRLSLNSSGDQVLEQNDLFTSLSGPLGVTAQGDADPFPGTIWIGQFFTGNITVFEPQDFSECNPDTLDPNDASPNGYTYGDLIDNGLDPCNPSQVPPDFDQDFVSDLNDPDIDGDGIANENDLFDFDADNGRGTPLPHRLAWSSDTIGTLGGMTTYNAPGFTGLMAHPVSPISVFDQFNPDNLIPGGAAGIFTVESVTPGDAQLNTQENAFHFGVDVHGGSPVFTAQSRIMAPFAGTVPQGNQSMGLVIGRGNQDNYIKLVTNANGGDGGIQFASEILGALESQQINADILGADYVDLYLVIDPTALSVEASYVIVNDGVRGPRTVAGQSMTMPSGWLSDVTNGLAIGIISTSSGADPFSASWGFIEAYEGIGEGFPPAIGHLEADPPALAFPNTMVGNTAVQVVTLSNTGNAALEISDAPIIGDQVFLTDLTLPISLDPGATHDISISFTPDDAIVFEAVLSLTHDGGNSPLQISMSGEGFQPELVLEPEPGQLDFGGVVAGATSEPQGISLVNTGEAAVAIGNLGIGGAAAQDFSLEAATDDCSGATLAPSEDCSFAVQFQPTQAGERTGQVNIPSNAGELVVVLQGQGLVALDLEINAAPDPVIAGNPLTYTLVVTNLTSAQADNVALAIALPPEATGFTTVGCEQDPAGRPNCTLGPIPANGDREVVVTVDIASSAIGPLQLGASASADNLLEPVTGEKSTPVTIVADLALVMTGDVVPLDAQTMALMYVIVVSNAGPSDAVSAMVMTELAAGLDNIVWSCQADAMASCSGSGVGEIDDLADLSAGTSVTYLVDATVSRALIEEGVTSSCEVAPSGEATDPDPNNNSSSITISDRLFHDRFEIVEE